MNSIKPPSLPASESHVGPAHTTNGGSGAHRNSIHWIIHVTNKQRTVEQATSLLAVVIANRYKDCCSLTVFLVLDLVDLSGPCRSRRWSTVHRPHYFPSWARFCAAASIFLQPSTCILLSTSPSPDLSSRCGSWVVLFLWSHVVILCIHHIHDARMPFKSVSSFVQWAYKTGSNSKNDTRYGCRCLQSLIEGRHFSCRWTRWDSQLTKNNCMQHQLLQCTTCSCELRNTFSAEGAMTMTTESNTNTCA